MWRGCHPSVSESLELHCRGCLEGFEGWTGCHPSVSEFVELQPAAAAQRVLKGGQAYYDSRLLKNVQNLKEGHAPPNWFPNHHL